MAWSSKPAARSISTHIFLSTAGGQPPALIRLSMPAKKPLAGFEILNFRARLAQAPFEHRSARLAPGSQERPDLLERQAGLPEMTNPLQQSPVLGGVDPVSRLRAPRRRQEPDPVIIEERASRQIELPGQL